MYFSKENLDISGSAWKKYHAGMAFLLARIVLVLKLYIQGESCVRPMQASARLRPGSGILLSGVPDYFGRNKISSGGDLSHYSSASLY